MTPLHGKSLTYIYENNDSYRVSFDDAGATWTALSGPATGSTGTETYDCAEVAPNVFFVSWLEESAEVVSFVANLNESTITCSYVFEKERHFWKGKITDFS